MRIMVCGNLKSQVGACSAVTERMSRLHAAGSLVVLVSGQEWLPCIPVSLLDRQAGASGCGFQPAALPVMGGQGLHLASCPAVSFWAAAGRGTC